MVTSLGATSFVLITSGEAKAALVRRTFDLNASTQSGNGFFDYDDANLTMGSFGNQFTEISNAVFGFTGENQQNILDPLALVNFDSAGNFLGIDLEIPGGSTLSSVLIANNDAYIPANTQVGELGVVLYGAPAAVPPSTPVPTPALLPGLLALGLKLKRRQQAA